MESVASDATTRSTFRHQAGFPATRIRISRITQTKFYASTQLILSAGRISAHLDVVTITCTPKDKP